MINPGSVCKNKTSRSLLRASFIFAPNLGTCLLKGTRSFEVLILLWVLVNDFTRSNILRVRSSTLLALFYQVCVGTCLCVYKRGEPGEKEVWDTVFNIFLYSKCILYFFTPSDNLCLLIGVFRQFALKVIINIVRLISTMFITVFYLLYFCFVHLPGFSASSGCNWVFYMISFYFLSLHSKCTSLKIFCVVAVEFEIYIFNCNFN